MEDSELTVAEGAVHMRVNHGSKIKNLMGYGIKRMKDPLTRQMTWNGAGQAITKAVSCVEIMKRKIKGLHQITATKQKRIEEYWEPTMEGLERLRVNRDIPAVTVLLSKDPLDASHPSYQAPGETDSFWQKTLHVKSDQRKSRKGAPSGDVKNSEFDAPTFSRNKKRKGEGRGGGTVGGGRGRRQGTDERREPTGDRIETGEPIIGALGGHKAKININSKTTRGERGGRGKRKAEHQKVTTGSEGEDITSRQTRVQITEGACSTQNTSLKAQESFPS